MTLHHDLKLSVASLFASSLSSFSKYVNEWPTVVSAAGEKTKPFVYRVKWVPSISEQEKNCS